jgi:GTP-binding protein
MIVGEQNKPGDLVVNIVEAKQLNNMRASGKDKDGGIAPKSYSH